MRRMPSQVHRAAESRTEMNENKHIFHTYILRSISLPDQRYIGNIADFQAALYIIKFQVHTILFFHIHYRH